MSTNVVISVSGPTLERETWVQHLRREIPGWDAMSAATVVEHPAEQSTAIADAPIVRPADWYPGYLMEEIRQAGGVVDEEDGSVTWPGGTKITMSPDALMLGDKVRVSFDIEIGDANSTADRGLLSALSLKHIVEARGATIELLERPLVVGDEVSWPKVIALGTLRGIDGDEAWVKWSSGDRDYSTVKLGELKRA